MDHFNHTHHNTAHNEAVGRRQRLATIVAWWVMGGNLFECHSREGSVPYLIAKDSWDDLEPHKPVAMFADDNSPWNPESNAGFNEMFEGFKSQAKIAFGEDHPFKVERANAKMVREAIRELDGGYADLRKTEEGKRLKTFSEYFGRLCSGLDAFYGKVEVSEVELISLAAMKPIHHNRPLFSLNEEVVIMSRAYYTDHNEEDEEMENHMEPPIFATVQGVDERASCKTIYDLSFVDADGCPRSFLHDPTVEVGMVISKAAFHKHYEATTAVSLPSPSSLGEDGDEDLSRPPRI